MTKAKDRRGYVDWPRRDVERATDARPTPQRGRKNTRRWCKGKVGVEHVTEVRLNKHATSPWRNGTPPCYRADWSKHWWCNHEEYCTRCGKTTRASLENDCPDYTTEVTRHRTTELTRIREATRSRTDDD